MKENLIYTINAPSVNIDDVSKALGAIGKAYKSEVAIIEREFERNGREKPKLPPLELSEVRSGSFGFVTAFVEHSDMALSLAGNASTLFQIFKFGKKKLARVDKREIANSKRMQENISGDLKETINNDRTRKGLPEMGYSDLSFHVNNSRKLLQPICSNKSLASGNESIILDINDGKIEITGEEAKRIDEAMLELDKALKEKVKSF